MTPGSSLIKRTFCFLVVFTMLFFKVDRVAAQISYNISLSASLNNGYLYLKYYAQNTGSVSFTFGHVFLNLKPDTAVLDPSKATIFKQGTWAKVSNADYNPMNLSYSKALNALVLSISPSSSATGNGVAVPTSPQLIGIVKIPVLKCFSLSSLSWGKSHVENWNSVDITPYGSFLPLNTLPPCFKPNGTLSINPGATVCPGDSIVLDVAVTTGPVDSIIFYKNGSPVQKGNGSQTSFGTKTFATGDTFSATLKYCNCPVTTLSGITIKVLDSGSVNLGNDTTLCPGAMLTLNAGSIKGASYLWSTGQTSSSITVSNGGNYWVKVSSGSCSVSDTIQVNYAHDPTQAPQPYLSNFSKHSLTFQWPSVVYATSYLVSKDSISWVSTSQTSYTLSSLVSDTTYCIWVKAANACDTSASQKACGNTADTCTITYQKTPDTSACSKPYSVNLYLKNINFPTYEIIWEANPPSRNLTYTATGNVSRQVLFTVKDSTDATCFKLDSIKISIDSANANWTGLDTSYCVSGYASQLVPVQSGGEFIGSGVTYDNSNGNWYFDPGTAGPGNHSISYVLCADTVTKTTNVLSAPCVSTVVSGGASGSSLVENPQGIFTNCDGSIYYTNYDSNTVYKINPYGQVSKVAGPTGLDGPTSLTVDPNTGMIYVADTKSSSIKEIDPTTGTVTLIAGGVFGSPFQSPEGITFGPNYQYLYVADAGSENIYKVSVTAPYTVTPFAGPAASGTLQNMSFVSLNQLAADSNYLYVTDPGPGNEAIYRINLHTLTYDTMVTSVPLPGAGYVDGVKGVYKVASPWGISVDGSGNAYFTDYTNCAIRMSDGNSVTTIAGKQPGTSGANCGNVSGSGFNARFNGPTALSVYVKGYIDVADTKNNAIRRISITNWASSPFNGFQKKYCQYDNKDTLVPLYKGGYYICSPVASAVYRSAADSNWYFDPKIAGPGYQKIGYVYTVGYCSDTIYTEAYVAPSPKPYLGPDSTFCDNQFGKQRLDGGYYTSYAWYKNDTLLTSDTLRYLTVTGPGQYVVIVSDTTGCQGSDTINISGQVVPSVTLPKDTGICYGQTITLKPVVGAGTIKSYSWQDGSSDSVYTTGNAGKYFVQVDFTSGCSNADTINLKINALPTVVTGNDTTVCSGKPATLFVAPHGSGYKIDWSPASVLSDSSLYDPVATITSSTQFNVIVTDSLGCSNSGSQFVEVSSPQIITSVFSPVKCQNDTVQLSVSTIGGAGDTSTYKYSWSPTSGLSNPLIQDPKAWNQTTQTYQVTVMDSLKCTASRYITVNSIAITASAGPDKPLCIGSSVQIGSGTLDSNFLYTWSPSTGLDNPNTLKPNASPVVTTQYILHIQHKTANCEVTDTMVVTVNPVPTVVAKNDTMMCKGDSVLLTGTPSSGNYTYLWSAKNGTVSTPDTSETWITPAVGGDVKVYFKVTDSITGCYASDSVTLTVSDPVVTSTVGVTICYGDSIGLNASMTGGLGSTSSWSYLWTPGKTLSDSTVYDPIARPTATTYYTVTITDSIGCSGKKTVLVSIPSLNVNAGRDTLICYGDSAQIGTDYTLPPYNAPSNAYTFVWTPTASLSNYKIAQPYAKPLSNTTYKVKVYDLSNCFVGSDTVQVNIIPLPPIDAGPNAYICKDSTVQLNASPDLPNYQYLWTSVSVVSPNNIYNPTTKPSVTSEYYLKITDTTGCSNQDSLTVFVSNPAAVAIATPDSICPGATTILDAQMNDALGSSSSWKFFWTPGSLLSDSTVQDPAVTLNASANFNVVMRDSIGCLSNTATVSVYVPALVADAGPDTTAICFQNQVQIGNTPAGYIYHWSPAAGLSDTTIAQPIAQPSVTTEYVLNVTDSSNCNVGIDSILVQVNPLPATNAGPDKLVCADSSVFLNGKPQGGGYQYSWTANPGVLGSPSLDTTSVSFGASVDTSLIQLNVTNAVTGCGKADTAYIYISHPVATVAPINDTVCLGDSVQLVASLSGGIGSSSTWTYTWTPVATITNPVIANPWVMPDTQTVYQVTIKDSIGCSSPDSANVFVPQPVANAGPDTTTVCSKDSVQIGTLPASSGFIYSWSPSAGLSSDTVAQPLASPAASRFYYVTVTDTAGCNRGRDSIWVQVLSLPSVDAGPNQYICKGTKDTLAGKPVGPGYMYLWSGGSFSPSATVSNPVVSPASNTEYYLTVTDSVGCKANDSVAVYIDVPAVSASLSADSICPTDTVTLTATGSGVGATSSWSYLWSGLKLQAPTQAVTRASPGKTAKYVIAFTDSAGCVAKDSVTLHVKPVFVDAGQDTFAICGGQSVTIGPSGMPAGVNTFYWTPAAGLDDSTKLNPVASPALSTTYYFVVNATTCGAFDSVFVKVYPKVKILNTRNEFCYGDSLQLITNISDSSSGFAWTPNSYISSVTAQSPYVFPAPGNDTTYVVTVTNPLGCVSQDSIKVKGAIDLSSIVAYAFNSTICPGDSAQLQFTGLSSDLNRISSFYWEPGSTLKDSTISKPWAFPLDTTTYVLHVTDSIGCMKQSPYTINTYPVSLDAGPDQSICVGDSIQIGMPAQAGYAYSWSPGKWLNDSTIAQPIAKVTASTWFYLNGTSPDACHKQDSMRVLVNPLPVTSTSSDTLICPQTSVQIEAYPAGSSFHYTWSPSAGLNNDTLQNPIAAPLSNTKYLVMVTDSNSCSDTASVVISVDPLKIDSLKQSETIICPGGKDTLIAYSSYTGVWYWKPALQVSDSTSALTVASALTSTLFVVSITDTMGCRDTATVDVIVNGLSLTASADTTVCEKSVVNLLAQASGGNGALTYNWTPGFVNPADSAQQILASVGISGYVVHVTDTLGCLVTDTVIVTGNPKPTTYASPTGASSITLCQNDTVTLGATPAATGGTTPYAYTWNAPDTSITNLTIANPVARPFADSTVYVLSVTDLNNCTATDSVKVFVNPLPDATIVADKNPACLGDTVHLSIPATNTGFTISWMDSSGTVINSGSLSVSVDTAEIYAVAIQNPLTGCSNSASYQVNYETNPDSLKVLYNPVCQGAPVTLQASALGDSLSYVWSSSVGVFSTSSLPQTAFTASSSGPYAVTVKAFNSCDTLTASYTINYNPKPVITYTIAPSQPSVDGAVTFDNTTGKNSLTSWNFGDGTASNDSLVVHYYTAEGVYPVQLIVQNASGCFDTVSVSLTVGAKAPLYIPNVLNPHASDPENRVAKVYGSNISGSGFSFKVFNRWGEMIFNTQDFNQMHNAGWAGVDQNNNDRMQQSGVFTYVLKGQYQNGKEFERTGTITILR